MSKVLLRGELLAVPGREEAPVGALRLFAMMIIVLKFINYLIYIFILNSIIYFDLRQRIQLSLAFIEIKEQQDSQKSV